MVPFWLLSTFQDGFFQSQYVQSFHIPMFISGDTSPTSVWDSAKEHQEVAGL